MTIVHQERVRRATKLQHDILPIIHIPGDRSADVLFDSPPQAIVFIRGCRTVREGNLNQLILSIPRISRDVGWHRLTRLCYQIAIGVVGL